jgi:endo-1,3(4)-beta-glucanase
MENLAWLMFTSEPITLVFDMIGRTTISTQEKFTGVIRLAMLPPPQKELTEYAYRYEQTYESVLKEGEASPGIQMLIDNSNLYPIGADVSWSFPSKNVGNLRFEYKTKSLDTSKKGGGDLLMLALPHHVDVMSMHTSKEYKLITHKDDFDLTYRTIKGHMTPVLGSVWSYSEDLTTIGFDDKSALEKAAQLNHKTRTTILDQVALDVKRLLPTVDENIYGYGKQIARLAQLIHIAKVLLDASDSSSLDKKYGLIIQESQAVLFDLLTAFLSGSTADALVYDTNFGGLVTQDGLDSSMNDFGNGWYNDHHFHYGKSWLIFD